MRSGSVSASSRRDQAQLIVGLLSPATLLDILRDYVVYEPERGRLVKKLPRYQQYRAVRAALDRLLSGRKPGERGGVVWHTQGSGKSLTMLWLATEVRRESRLADTTIVVVTDRRQLMDRSRPEPPERRSRRRMQRPDQRDPLDLQSVLKQGGSRMVMTTIQKFEKALTAPEGEVDVLNASENVIVMVDEAHRTQYGILGGRMSKALPNAVMVGFTGTPIEKDFKRSTIGRFGPLIDAYTIPQSVADGATVPIWYEARLPELAIEGPETLDKLYEAMFGDEPPAVQMQIRRRYANKETVAEAERRIEMIALDHRRALQGEGAAQRVQGAGGRAEPDRRPAVRGTPEQLRPARLPRHHGCPQRRPRSSRRPASSTRSRSSTPSSIRRGSRRRWSWSTCCLLASTRQWSRCCTWTELCGNTGCSRPSPG